ncbi:hypothetical protein LX36DRAFT_94952 [Colletotrichum falcatum]|nr:hypothetical protein LX36DRAFT_94952 [Colletotrichum falcatum]
MSPNPPPSSLIGEPRTRSERRCPSPHKSLTLTLGFFTPLYYTTYPTQRLLLLGCRTHLLPMTGGGGRGSSPLRPASGSMP